MVEAIQQASCTECDSYGSFEREDSNVGQDQVGYNVECQECGATATIWIDEDGVRLSDEETPAISYEDASWTEEDQEDD